MNTNSDRHRGQLFIESKIVCQTAADLEARKEEFEAYHVGHLDVTGLTEALAIDADALFQKGVQTFVQALIALDASQQSWALIKLYYATYFFLREALARDGTAILRCKSIYTLRISVGERPVRKKSRGDHQAAIGIYSSQFEGRDVLLSQQIDGHVSYDWLREKRDWINYKRRDFIDGLGEKGLTSELVSFPNQVATYCDDSVPIFCFDPDFAALALPIKRAQNSIKARGSEGIDLLNKWIGAAKQAGMRTPSADILAQSIG